MNSNENPNISENLKVAVNAGNLPDVRGALWSCLQFDRTMTGVYKERLEYVRTHRISDDVLFEKDDRAPFEKSPTEENFNNLLGLLKVNFSKEKLDALKRMGQQLYTKKIQPKTAPEVPPQGGRDTAGTAQPDKCCPQSIARAGVVFIIAALLGAAVYWLVRICR